MIFRLPFLYDEFAYTESYDLFYSISTYIYSNLKYEILVVFGGSCAKKTSINYNELDIFVQLKNKNISFQNFVSDLFFIFRDFNYILKYSSHPYLTLKINNKEIDVVPCIQFISEIKTPVDRSIKHVEYINIHLKNPFDVISIKTILKNNLIYGAESYISGISGYTCEVILAQYPLNKLNENNKLIKFEYILDPVDKNRNILACTSKSNIFKFNEILYKLSGKTIRNLSFDLYLQSFLKGLKLLILSSNLPIQKFAKNIRKTQQYLDKNNFFINFEIFKQQTSISIIETSKYEDTILYRIKGPNFLNTLDFKKFTSNFNTYWYTNGIYRDKLIKINLFEIFNKFAKIELYIDYTNYKSYINLIKLYYGKKYGPL